MVEIELVREVYKNASSVQQYLIESEISGISLYKISNKYFSDKNKDFIFCRIISHIILGFYKIEDTVPLLQQELELDKDTAEKLGAEVLEFLKPLSDPNWQPPPEEEEGNTSMANEVVSNTPTTRVPVAENSLAINEPVAIPEIRTMASDMAQERSPARSTFNAMTEIDEPVYVSNQPEIEKKTIEVPSYATPVPQSSNMHTSTDDSRWK